MYEYVGRATCKTEEMPGFDSYTRDCPVTPV